MEHIQYDKRIPQCLKVLSNPVRLDIFLKVLEKSCECDVDTKAGAGGNCVTQIAVELEIPQPTVSNHIKELVNCGLVISKRQGRKVFLFVSNELISDISEFLMQIAKEAKASDPSR
jgi:DNA-binding transcriptional ArsR family regulator